MPNKKRPPTTVKNALVIEPITAYWCNAHFFDDLKVYKKYCIIVTQNLEISRLRNAKCRNSEEVTYVLPRRIAINYC